MAEIPMYDGTLPANGGSVPAGGGSAGADSGAGDAGGGDSGEGRSEVDGPRLLDTSEDDDAEAPGRGGGKRKDSEKRKGTEKRKGVAPPADRPNADAREVGRSRGRAPKEQTLPQPQRWKAELAPAKPPRAQPPQVEVPLPPVQPGGPPDHAGEPPVQPGGPPVQAGGPPNQPGGPPDQLPNSQRP